MFFFGTEEVKKGKNEEVGKCWNTNEKFICFVAVKIRRTQEGGNSQNFLRKFLRFFVTLRCFNKVVNHIKRYLMIYSVVNITL